MMFIKITDLSGSIEAVVFTRTMAEYKQFLIAEKCVAIKAKVSYRNGEISLVVEKMKAL